MKVALTNLACECVRVPGDPTGVVFNGPPITSGTGFVVSAGGAKGPARFIFVSEDGSISGKQAKDVFAEMAATGDAPGAIVELKGVKQVSDTDAIEAAADAVITANPSEVEAYRGGKTGLMGFFVGQVMREMRGQANPAVVNEVLRAKLGG